MTRIAMDMGITPRAAVTQLLWVECLAIFELWRWQARQNDKDAKGPNLMTMEPSSIASAMGAD